MFTEPTGSETQDFIDPRDKDQPSVPSIDPPALSIYSQPGPGSTRMGSQLQFPRQLSLIQVTLQGYRHS